MDIPQLYGRTVYDSDGDKVGTIDEVYLDAQTGDPEWLAVKTGLFGLKQSFVPLRGAEIGTDRVVVPFDKARVKDAPKIDPDGQLSHREEDELYTYYGYASTDGNVTGDATARHAERTTTTETRGSAAGGHAETRGRTESRDTNRGDDAMTRSEERLVGGTRTEEAGKARLRKYVVTEQEQVTVPVQREEVRLEREPITDANRGPATAGPDITESEHEVTLRAERPVVDTEAVPVERVRLGKETVTDEERVSGEVRKERIDYDGPGRDRS